ncbi:MAG TPA: BTAD domain-containing putative transcriptional regulator [Gemmatimonadaceae bacterium]|nr:BTAD domain-containing putative transcriptional regulator [Gemmatimonadaceae bacterium]
MARRRESHGAGAEVRIYVCGRFAIEKGETIVRESDFPARQGRRLWAALVLQRRRPAGRERLAEAVWGDAIPDAWDTALNALVSRLRAALRRLGSDPAAPSLRGEVGRYELLLAEGTFVDFERARTAIHAAETSLRGGDPGAALAEARVAMEIAGRGFLPGEEGAWIEAARRELSDITVRALESTIEGELLRGNPSVAEREARYLLGLDPLRESGYRLLMRALSATGNGAQLARVVADCRRILLEQAGMSPSADTERLFRELTAPPRSGRL